MELWGCLRSYQMQAWDQREAEESEMWKSRCCEISSVEGPSTPLQGHDALRFDCTRLSLSAAC